MAQNNRTDYQDDDLHLAPTNGSPSGRADIRGDQRQSPDKVAALLSRHQSDLVVGNHTKILPGSGKGSWLTGIGGVRTRPMRDT